MKETFPINGDAQAFRRAMHRSKDQQSKWLLEDDQPEQLKNIYPRLAGTDFVLGPLNPEYEEIKECSKWKVQPVSNEGVHITVEANDFNGKALVDVSGEDEFFFRGVCGWVKAELKKVSLWIEAQSETPTNGNEWDSWPEKRTPSGIEFSMLSKMDLRVYKLYRSGNHKLKEAAIELGIGISTVGKISRSLGIKWAARVSTRSDS